jgi:hypothetical protein
LEPAIEQKALMPEYQVESTYHLKHLQSYITNINKLEIEERDVVTSQ